MSLCSVRPRPAPATAADCSSSVRTALNRKSFVPPPPNASGASKARNPWRPASANTSRGTIPSASHARSWGTTSLSSHARKLARNASWSSSYRSRFIPAG